MYTDKHGAVLLECNPRVGGGPIRYFNNLLNGMLTSQARPAADSATVASIFLTRDWTELGQPPE